MFIQNIYADSLQFLDFNINKSISINRFSEEMKGFYSFMTRPPMSDWGEYQYNKKYCRLLPPWKLGLLLKGAKNVKMEIQEAQEKKDIISQMIDGKNMNYIIPEHLANQYYELTIKDDISLYHIDFIEDDYYTQEEINEMNYSLPLHIKKLTQYHPVIINFQSDLLYSQDLKNFIQSYDYKLYIGNMQPYNIEHHNDFSNIPNGFTHFMANKQKATQTYFGKSKRKSKIGTIDDITYINFIKKCNQ